MTDTGKLLLSIAHNGGEITGVEMISTRPQASQLLKNKTPEQAVQLSRSLFGLCGKAQGTAAEAAVAAARGVNLIGQAVLERAVAYEALQEHCWRLLLDWPKMLGLPQQQTEFIRWHASLRHIEQENTTAQQQHLLALKHEIETLWLGMTTQEWLKIQHWQDLTHWWETNNSPAAQLFAALAAVDTQTTQSATSLLPNRTAAEMLAAGALEFDADFAARPVCNKLPAETGALAYHADVPLLLQVLQRSSSRLLARVLARLHDAVQILNANFSGRFTYASSKPGSGLSMVNTARGVLMHLVCINAEQVQDYLIVAPTEWNFHPAGTLVTSLLGVRGDVQQMLKRAEMQVLTLDPCIGYEIKVG